MKRRIAFSVLPSTPRLGYWLAGIVLILPMQALGQQGYRQNTISPFDLYGNAQSIRRERRSIGLFQNNTQLEMLRGYQYRGRRQNQRGGESTFALSTDRALRTSNTSMILGGYSLGSRVPVARTSAGMQQAFSRFGGFGVRAGGVQIGDAALALSRKYDLIQATSLNAPVRRAFWDKGVSMGIHTSVEQTPFRKHDPLVHAAEADLPTLNEKLVKQVMLSHARSQQQGWGWFEESEYRRAVRSFETAIILESDDVESRIGLIFSHLSLGAMQSTITLLRGIYRHDINPFELDFLMTHRFDNPNDARQLVFQLRSQTERYQNNPDLSALYALALWFTGDRDEAQSVMKRAGRKESRSPYDDWLHKMQTAHKSHPSP